MTNRLYFVNIFQKNFQNLGLFLPNFHHSDGTADINGPVV